MIIHCGRRQQKSRKHEITSHPSEIIMDYGATTHKEKAQIFADDLTPSELSYEEEEEDIVAFLEASCQLVLPITHFFDDVKYMIRSKAKKKLQVWIW